MACYAPKLKKRLGFWPTTIKHGKEIRQHLLIENGRKPHHSCAGLDRGVALAPSSDPQVIPNVIANVMKVKEEPGKPITQTLGERFHCDHVVFQNSRSMRAQAPVVLLQLHR